MEENISQEKIQEMEPNEKLHLIKKEHDLSSEEINKFQENTNIQKIDFENDEITEKEFKIFQCKYCKQTFAQSVDLKQHIENVHEGFRKYNTKHHNMEYDMKLNRGEISGKNFPEIYNPWIVGRLEEFLYFCCPECDERNQSKELFLQHALEHHPLAKGMD